MMSMPTVASIYQTVQQISDSAGLELLMFFLAFGMHFVLFGRYGLMRKTKSKTRRIEAAGQSPKPGDVLARSLQSLMQMPGVKLDLQLRGSESSTEIEALLAAAPAQTEQDIVCAAVAKQRTDVLRHFLSSRSTGALQTLAKNLMHNDRDAVALQCAKVAPRKGLQFLFYNAIMEMLCEKKDLAGVRQVLALAVEDSGADVNVRNWLVRALAQAGELGEAKQAIEDMKKAGIRPNLTSFTPILDAQKESFEKCLATVKEIKGLGIELNNFVCSTVLRSITKGTTETQVDRALQLINSREVCEKDSALLASLCEACARSGNYRALIGHLKSMSRAGAQAQFRCAHTVGTIIRAYGMVEDLDGVWSTWHEMKRRRMEPTRITLGCMVEALASNNDPEGAHGIIREVLAQPESKGLMNVVIYNSVLKSFSHQKRFDQVWKIYEEMLSEKIELSIATYNALLDACARSSEIGRADPIFKDMIKQGMQPNIITYGAMIKAYCTANCLDEAFAVMEELKKTELKPDEIIYNTLLDGCARYGFFDRGIELLASMRKAGLPPSNYTLSVVAKLASRCKKPEKAFELVDDLAKEFGLRLNVHVYNNLLHAASCMTDLDKAQEIFALMVMEKVRPDSRTYMLLLRLCSAKKSADVAVVILRLLAGLPYVKEKASHPWKKEILVPALALALRRMPSASWAAAPRHGKDAMQTEVLSEAFDFLARSQKQGDSEEFTELLKEVQKAFPAVRLNTRTGQRCAKPK